MPLVRTFPFRGSALQGWSSQSGASPDETAAAGIAPSRPPGCGAELRQPACRARTIPRTSGPDRGVFHMTHSLIVLGGATCVAGVAVVLRHWGSLRTAARRSGFRSTMRPCGHAGHRGRASGESRSLRALLAAAAPAASRAFICRAQEWQRAMERAAPATAQGSPGGLVGADAKVTTRCGSRRNPAG